MPASYRWMGETAPSAEYPAVDGDSRGHWEGIYWLSTPHNFTDKTNFRGSGVNMHLIERFNALRSGHAALPIHCRRSAVVCEPLDAEIPWGGLRTRSLSTPVTRELQHVSVH